MQVKPEPRIALVTGGADGLGFAISREFLLAGYSVVMVGRRQERLAEAASELTEHVASEATIDFIVGDLTVPESVAHVFASCDSRFGRLDVLVNCVGASDRGTLDTVSLEHLDALMRTNVHTALLCSQKSLPLLQRSQGAIVNIGSLASKVGARYLGGYAIVKHALAGMTQQMRLELAPLGVHVGIVCPGPIRRSDAGQRYKNVVGDSLPAQVNAPGAGAKLKGLDPAEVARCVRRCAEQRQPEVILPRYIRWLTTLGNAFPRIGDKLLLKFTSSKS